MALRIALFYPSNCVWKPVDPANIWSSSRGLTGSEIAFFMYALELSRRGHGVTVFTKFTKGGDIEKVTCCQYEEWESIYKNQHWDALCSWMTPEPLFSAPSGSLRLFNQQVSDFNMCRPGWENVVDLVAPLSSSHARYMRPTTSFPSDKWRVMHNGVDTDAFKPGTKVPGKMVWASSHDRGLHWLLEVFPKVRARVPHANLHVFYDFGGVDRFASIPDEDQNPNFRELGFRSRYVKEALRRLEGKGVHVHQSVSRERMQREMAEAEVLAYPCDPVHYTETFGVTVLEACASGAVPVICTADAFGELWGDVVPNVPAPFSLHRDEYVDRLCSVLLDPEHRRRYSEACVSHAERFRWSDLASRLEQCLLTRGVSGLPNVEWSST